MQAQMLCFRNQHHHRFVDLLRKSHSQEEWWMTFSLRKSVVLLVQDRTCSQRRQVRQANIHQHLPIRLGTVFRRRYTKSQWLKGIGLVENAHRIWLSFQVPSSMTMVLWKWNWRSLSDYRQLERQYLTFRHRLGLNTNKSPTRRMLWFSSHSMPDHPMQWLHRWGWQDCKSLSSHWSIGRCILLFHLGQWTRWRRMRLRLRAPWLLMGLILPH